MNVREVMTPCVVIASPDATLQRAAEMRIDIDAGDKGHAYMQKEGIDWVSHYPAEEGKAEHEAKSGKPAADS